MDLEFQNSHSADSGQKSADQHYFPTEYTQMCFHTKGVTAYLKCNIYTLDFVKNLEKRIIWCVTCRIFYTRRIFYGSRNFYHQKVYKLRYILHTYDFFIALIDQKLSSFEIQNSFDSLVFFGFITSNCSKNALFEL